MIWVILATLLIIILVSWLSLLNDSKKLGFPGPVPLPLVGNGLVLLGDSTPVKRPLLNTGLPHASPRRVLHTHHVWQAGWRAQYGMLIHGKTLLPIFWRYLLGIPLNRLLDFLDRCFELVESYGRVVRIYRFSSRYLLITDPKYIEAIVSSTDLIVKGKSYKYVRPWLGEGLLTSAGQRWKSHRKFLTPAFHFNILQNFLPVFCKNGKILVDKMADLANGSPVNLFPIIALTALDNVTESIMGVSVNTQKDSESSYLKAIKELTVLIALKMRNPFIGEDVFFNMLPHKTRQDTALATLHGQTKRVIDARREELRKNNITGLPSETNLGNEGCTKTNLSAFMP